MRGSRAAPGRPGTDRAGAGSRLARQQDSPKPLLHAKLLVLGDLVLNVYGPDDSYGEERLDFEPRTVWWGSANWTEMARSHLEVGFACDDPALAEQAADFVADVIAFSEPVTTTSPTPKPNLVRVEFDDAAMAEAAREMDQEYDADEPEDW